MEPKPIVELHTFRHPGDEQLQHSYIFSNYYYLQYIHFELQFELTLRHCFWKFELPINVISILESKQSTRKQFNKRKGKWQKFTTTIRRKTTENYFPYLVACSCFSL